MLAQKLHELAGAYPPEHAAGEHADVERIVYHVGLLSTVEKGSLVVDVGGGRGLFSLACQVAGYQAVVIDPDPDREGLFDLHRANGVKVLQQSIFDKVELGPLGAVTSFHTIEHLHHSPRSSLRHLSEQLVPGGMFLLCGPNSANLRKRLAVTRGRAATDFDGWYMAPQFEGHVREPVLSDLRRIADDLDLADVRTWGRNWLGHDRLAGRLSDRVLRPFPTLCSDIYVSGARRS